MPGRFELPCLWDCIHQREPVSERPEAGMLAFLEGTRAGSAQPAPILDAGCGRGRNLLALSGAGFQVYACDLSQAALGIAKARAQEAGAPVRFLASDLTSLPFLESFFAAAICVHVLPYHFKTGIIKGMRELWRVLQPNGWLYLDLLDLEDAEYGCGKKLEQHTFLAQGGIPLHFSSRQEIDELMQGFALERASRLEFTPSLGRTRVSWSIWAMKCNASSRELF